MPIYCNCVKMHISVIRMHFSEIARDFLHRTTNYNVVAGLMSPVHDKYGKEVSFFCDYSDVQYFGMLTHLVSVLMIGTTVLYMVLYLYYFLMCGREQMCRLIICGPISQFFSCAHSHRQLAVPGCFLYEVSRLILSGPRFDNVHRFFIFVYAPTPFYLFS